MNRHRHAGVTLIELMVAIAIVGILSAVVVPNVLRWSANGRVNAAAQEVIALIQKTRIEAVKNNAEVVVTFSSGKYSGFLDNGEGGGAVNGKQDGAERTVGSGNLPPGVEVSTSFAGYISFDNRAMLSKTDGNPSINDETITLKNSRGYAVRIQIEPSGIPRII